LPCQKDLAEKNQPSDAHHENKIKITGHMAQVKKSDCSSAEVRPLVEGCSLICVLATAFYFLRL
jgi:hypothetical protein